MDNSNTLVVVTANPALGRNVTVATIGSGEDVITFNLHGGTEISVAADLAKIAANHECGHAEVSGSVIVAALLRERGLEVADTSSPVAGPDNPA